MVEIQYMTMNLVTMPWFLANSAERRALKVYLIIDNFFYVFSIENFTAT